jgi:hypothetical protein
MNKEELNEEDTTMVPRVKITFTQAANMNNEFGIIANLQNHLVDGISPMANPQFDRNATFQNIMGGLLPIFTNNEEILGSLEKELRKLGDPQLNQRLSQRKKISFEK